MSSITAVRVSPIQKGSLTRLWVAVIILLGIAALLAWAGLREFGGTASGLRYQIIEAGKGPSPTTDDFALVAYKGYLPDGTLFDENAGVPMELKGTVPGFAEAVTLMRKGGRMRAWLPAKLAYGATPPAGSPVPPNAPLLFEIRLLEFKSRAEVEEAQRQAQMRQMMQQQMGGGMPPGAGGPPPQ